MKKIVTTVVAPQHLQLDLKKQWMHRQNKRSIQMISFLTLSQFLAQYQSEPWLDDNQQLIEMYHALKQFPAQVFAPVLLSVSFLQELLRIMNDLIDHGVDLQDFPDDNRSRRELKAILLHLRFSMRFIADQRAACLHALYQESDLSHILFSHVKPANYFEQQVLQAAVERYAGTEESAAAAENICYRYAINIRQEVEACAQEICTRLNQGAAYHELQIIVSDPTAYQAVLEQVFPRYGLPYYLINSKEKTIMPSVFEAIFQYYRKPDITTLISVFEQPVWALTYAEDWKQYLAIFSISYASVFQPYQAVMHLNQSVNQYTRAFLESLQQHASQTQVEILGLLNQVDSSSCSNIIRSYYNLIQAQQSNLLPQDISWLQQFRQVMQPLLSSLDELPLPVACEFARTIASGIHQSIPRKQPAILIGDLHHPLLPATYGFALGFHQAQYPNFKSRTGIFDETIASMLPQYESLAQRYHRHIDHGRQALQFAANLVLSYPQGNFEGKTFESSLDLELQFQLPKAAAWDIRELHHYQSTSHHLDPALAKPLFFRSGEQGWELGGSISQFETYAKCPYAYFLKYGLRLEEPKQFNLMNAEIGTIYHAFLEHAINMHGKQYTAVPDAFIQDWTQNQLRPYRELFPDDIRLFELIEEQIFHVLKTSLLQLHSMEQHTSFIPAHTEYQFNHIVASFEDITIRLRGIVDRIDVIAHGFRILDYKSSDRSFSPAQFYAGLSLQLVSYVKILAEILQKQPFGAYYFSLRAKEATHIPYSLDKRAKAISYLTEQDFLDSLSKPTKLTGITFISKESDILLLDDSQSHVQGLTKSSKGISVKNAKEFDEITAQLEELYQILTQRLLQGQIPLTPVERACTYCSYRLICHFQGQQMKPKPWIQTEHEPQEEIA